MKRVVVLGSVNEDLVVTGVPLPRPGETVTGGRAEQHHGGKGGNAAVAAARALRGGPLEGRVAFVGAVGDDDFGRAAVQALVVEGIDVGRVAVLPDAATGVALIVVAPDGENQIAVASGANARAEPGAVEAAVRDLLADGGVLLANLEVPVVSVLAAARAARAAGATVVVNPAPAGGFHPDLADLADALTPNEGELAALGGAVALLRGRPGLRLAISLGARGVRLYGPDGEEALPAHPVARVVDTTGAGDAFNGVLAAGLLEGREWREAAARATVAAGLSVGVAGAREGMPPRAAIDAATRSSA
ncbi:MAG TPA: PfkB family carbohydrate kinase [Candidatus Sulfotelmatobacter sp.]|nr:PfkB family carbohydrate kinase [Candidatus Sulfotelmatobacter sp.]